MAPVLPRSEQEWEDMARAAGVLDLNVHNRSDNESASKIKNGQFLTLRILWNFEKNRLKEYIDSEAHKVAQKELDLDKSWKAFQAIINKPRSSFSRSPILDTLGMYAVIQHSQDCVLRPNGVINPRPGKEAGQPELEPPREEPQEALTYEDASPKIERLTSSTFVHDQDGAGFSAVFGSTSQESPSLRGKTTVRPDFTDLSELEDTLPSHSPGQPVTPAARITREAEVSDFETPVLGTFPSPPASRPRVQGAKEESFVEAALHNFLLIITQRHLANTPAQAITEWSREHRRFACRDWVAITDGYLGTADGLIKAIIEVKPFQRHKELYKVRYQESAQMAAWICSRPNDFTNAKEGQPFVRLLISQDDDQVWLTFAEYDKEYEDYIRNIPPMRRKKSKKRSFLTMCEHGPWDIDNPEMMRQLGSLILALVYQHSGVDLDKLKADIVSRMKSGVKR